MNALIIGIAFTYYAPMSAPTYREAVAGLEVCSTADVAWVEQDYAEGEVSYRVICQWDRLAVESSKIDN